MLKMCIHLIGSDVQLAEWGGKSVSQSTDMERTSHIYHHNTQELSPYTMLNLTILKPTGAVYIYYTCANIK